MSEAQKKERSKKQAPCAGDTVRWNGKKYVVREAFFRHCLRKRDGEKVWCRLIGDSRSAGMEILSAKHWQMYVSDEVCPAYRLARRGESFEVCGAHERIELIARSREWLWKHRRIRPKFDTLREEAQFFLRMGSSAFVDDTTSLQEAVAMVAKGRGHVVVADSKFGSLQWFSVHRFKDKRLGRRVAAATRSGFKL